MGGVPDSAARKPAASGAAGATIIGFTSPSASSLPPRTDPSAAIPATARKVPTMAYRPRPAPMGLNPRWDGVGGGAAATVWGSRPTPPFPPTP